MSFDFPNAPTIGALYQPSGGPTYQWDGQKWVMAGSPVQFTPAYNQRNRIVNPAMQISQENGFGVSGSTVGYYPADQWRFGLGTTGVTPAIQALKATGNYKLISPAYLLMSAGGTAKPSLAATDNMSIAQNIEGTRLVDLNWGQGADAIPVVIRFTAWGTPGTYGLTIRNGGALDRSYVAPVTIDGTPREYIVAVPPCPDGTWPIDNSQGMVVNFCAASGTTYQTATPNQWLTGNFLAPTGQFNLFSAANQSIRLARVGLYADPLGTGIPPAWEMPDEAQELIACMRYWQQSFTRLSAMVTTGITYTASGSLAVPMRASPTISLANNAATGFSTTPGTPGGGNPASTPSHIYESRASTATANNGAFASFATCVARM